MLLTHLILLIDKKHTKFFILTDHSVERIIEKHVHEYIPQNVKHGDDTWDATDKIFRHIQDHLHRYLKKAMEEVVTFVGKEHIDDVYIGSHKTMFGIIQKFLPITLEKKVRGYVTIDMKAPFDIQLEKIKKAIAASQPQLYTHG